MFFIPYMCANEIYAVRYPTYKEGILYLVHTLSVIVTQFALRKLRNVIAKVQTLFDITNSQAKKKHAFLEKKRRKECYCQILFVTLP